MPPSTMGTPPTACRHERLATATSQPERTSPAPPRPNRVSWFRPQLIVFLASDTFAQLWVEVNRRAHARVVDVLEGDTGNRRPRTRGRDHPGSRDERSARTDGGRPKILGGRSTCPRSPSKTYPRTQRPRSRMCSGVTGPTTRAVHGVRGPETRRRTGRGVTVRALAVAVVTAVVLSARRLGCSPPRGARCSSSPWHRAGCRTPRRLGLRLEDDVVELAKPENQEAVAVVVGAFVDSLLDATAWILADAAVVAAVASHGRSTGRRRGGTGVDHQTLCHEQRSQEMSQPRTDEPRRHGVAHREALQIARSSPHRRPARDDVVGLIDARLDGGFVLQHRRPH